LTLKFTNWQCCDDRPALNIEESIQRPLGFSGVHSYEALDWVLEDFSESTSMVSTVDFEGPEGGWAFIGGSLLGVPTDDTQWYKVRYSEEIEIGFTTEFDKTGTEGAFLFMCGDGYASYAAWWTDSAVGVSRLMDDDEEVLTSIPMVYSGSSTVRIAVYPKMYSAIDQIDNIAVGMWFDGEMAFTYMIEFPNEVWRDLDIARKHVGFAVRNTSATFSNWRIPQLHQVREWTSVDPGEAASASVGRTIGQDNIRVQARYDGSVKIWRNESTSSDWSIPTGRALQIGQKHRHYSPSHVRLVGALHEADTFRSGNQGHVFVVGQDPNAIMEAETYDKGERRHKEIEESYDQIEIVCAPNVLLEPGDVVAFNSSYWRVENISLKIVMQGSGPAQVPVLGSSITCRKLLTS